VLGSVWSACIPLLQGAGRTIDAIRALTLQRVAFFVVALAGLLLAGRLEVLGLAHGAGILIGLGYGWQRVRRHVSRTDVRSGTQPSHTQRRELARHMIAGSVRLWLSRLGGFLVARSSLLLVSSTLGLRTTAAFALTIQLIQGLSAVAQAPLMAAMPRLYVARAQGQMAVLKTDVGKGLILAGMVFGAGALVILIAVAPLLEALGKPEALLPWGPLLVLVVAGALELNHSLFATLLLTNNEVPFVRAALASGLAIVVGVLLVLAYAPAPLMGVALVLLVVQLAYNNWKWPLAAMRSFGTSYAELLRMGLSWPTRPLP
jgi:O-antigen/teichoic acid export membrane protein